MAERKQTFSTVFFELHSKNISNFLARQFCNLQTSKVQTQKYSKQFGREDFRYWTIENNSVLHTSRKSKKRRSLTINISQKTNFYGFYIEVEFKLYVHCASLCYLPIPHNPTWKWNDRRQLIGYFIHMNLWFYIRPAGPVLAVSGSYRGSVSEHGGTVHLSPEIKAENGPICGYRIVNPHKGEIPFEVRTVFAAILTKLWRCSRWTRAVVSPSCAPGTPSTARRRIPTWSPSQLSPAPAPCPTGQQTFSGKI